MALLAIRHFVTLKSRGKIVLVGDALGVWYSLVRMNAKATKINEIAKELALHMAPLGHELMCIHVWSEENVLADALSRIGGDLTPRPESLRAPSCWIFLHVVFGAANVIVQVNCVAMFSRYPRSVLRHELDHNGRNTLSTLMLKPIRSRSNNEGMGSPTAASRLVEVVPNACGGQEDAKRPRLVCYVGGFVSRVVNCAKGCPNNGWEERSVPYSINQ